MNYTTQEHLQTEIQAASEREPLLQEIASDPSAPWWALWEVLFQVRHHWWPGSSVACGLCKKVLQNPALGLLLLEEPVWVSKIYSRCKGLLAISRYLVSHPATENEPTREPSTGALSM